MGNLVTVTFPRFIIRRLRRFNLASRVDKYMENPEVKHPVSPTFDATMKEVDRLLKEHPESLTVLKEKNEALHKNLEEVFVKSEGRNPHEYSNDRLDASMEYRIFELTAVANNINTKTVEKVPSGKYSVEDATQFLSELQKSTDRENSLKKISETYKINANSLGNVTNYVKVFDIMYPIKKKRKGYLQRVGEEMMPKSMLGKDEVQLMLEAIQEKEKEVLEFDKYMKRIEEKKKRKLISGEK